MKKANKISLWVLGCIIGLIVLIGIMISFAPDTTPPEEVRTETPKTVEPVIVEPEPEPEIVEPEPEPEIVEPEPVIVEPEPEPEIVEPEPEIVEPEPEPEIVEPEPEIVEPEKRDYEAEIKEYARKRWPNDSRMEGYEYNHQMEALFQIWNLPSTVDYSQNILEDAMAKWGEDYTLVMYEYENQLDAYKKMQ